MRRKSVAVFCASAPGADERYAQAACELGTSLAAHGVGLIYGGSQTGLMQAVADSCLAAGGHVTGVIPEVLVALEIAHRGLSELHVVDTMHTRKAVMSEKAEAFLVLPGGLGTMEEMFEVLAWQTLGLHDKPVVLINLGGYYDHLLTFLDRAVSDGLLRPQSRALLLEARSVAEALKLARIDAPAARPNAN